MVCRGCESYDVPLIVGHFCDFCGRIVSRADVDWFHREAPAPRKQVQDDKFDYAERSVT